MRKKKSSQNYRLQWKVVSTLKYSGILTKLKTELSVWGVWRPQRGWQEGRAPWGRRTSTTCPPLGSGGQKVAGAQGHSKASGRGATSMPAGPLHWELRLFSALPECCYACSKHISWQLTGSERRKVEGVPFTPAIGTLEKAGYFIHFLQRHTRHTRGSVTDVGLVIREGLLNQNLHIWVLLLTDFGIVSNLPKLSWPLFHLSDWVVSKVPSNPKYYQAPFTFYTSI